MCFHVFGGPGASIHTCLYVFPRFLKMLRQSLVRSCPSRVLRVLSYALWVLVSFLEAPEGPVGLPWGTFWGPFWAPWGLLEAPRDSYVNMLGPVDVSCGAMSRKHVKTRVKTNTRESTTTQRTALTCPKTRENTYVSDAPRSPGFASLGDLYVFLRMKTTILKAQIP